MAAVAPNKDGVAVAAAVAPNRDAAAGLGASVFSELTDGSVTEVSLAADIG